MEAISTQKRSKNILKLKGSGHPPKEKTYKGHRYYWEQMTSEIDYGTNKNIDKIKEMNAIQLYTVNLDSMLMHSHPTESQINIFTDCSLTDKHTRSGYPIQYKKKEILANSIDENLTTHTV